MSTTYKMNAVNTSTGEVESIELLGGGAINDIINILHPIGSIYMSFDPTNPKDIFGGEWEQIKGKFLLGQSDSYEVNTTGGEETHTLTTAELPSHNHKENILGQGYSGWPSYTTSTYEFAFDISNNGNKNYFSKGTNLNAVNISHNMNTDITGDSQAHNNMPPYIVVYIWKRIK